MENKKIKIIFWLIAFGSLIFSGRALAADTGILTVTKTGAGSVSSVGLYSPALSGSGLGSVGSVNGIDCGLDCSEEYSLYSVVTLVATPAAPNLVGKWTGCSVSASDPDNCAVTIFGNLPVSVQFVTPLSFSTITVKKSPSGDVAGLDCGTHCYKTVTAGSALNFKAVPANGYNFINWSGDVVACGSNQICGFVANGLMTAEANFAPLACSAVKNVTAGFTVPVGAPTCAMIASPASVAGGGAATITWSTTNNPTSAMIDNGIGSVSPSGGTVKITPANSTTYTMVVTNSAGNSPCTVTITVNTPPPTPPGGFLPKKIREILPF